MPIDQLLSEIESDLDKVDQEMKMEHDLEDEVSHPLYSFSDLDS